MMSEHKLNGGEIHLLKLIAKDSDAEGWTPVSKPVYALIDKLPKELVCIEPVGDEGRGHARLTERGQNIIDSLAWL